MLVEYQNGGVAGFDYITGEILFDNRVNDTTNFFAFAASFFDFELSLLSDEVSEVYGQVEVFSNKISQEPIENVLKNLGLPDENSTNNDKIDTFEKSEEEPNPSQSNVGPIKNQSWKGCITAGDILESNTERCKTTII